MAVSKISSGGTQHIHRQASRSGDAFPDSAVTPPPPAATAGQREELSAFVFVWSTWSEAKATAR